MILASASFLQLHSRLKGERDAEENDAEEDTADAGNHHGPVPPALPTLGPSGFGGCLAGLLGLGGVLVIRGYS